MHIQAIIISLMLSLSSLAAMAGTGHDHGYAPDPVTQSQAEEIATKKVSALMEKGKIDESWKSIKATKSERKRFGGKMEWVIAFNNKNVSDPENQTLYIFLSIDGKYLAANYTGN